MKHQLMVLSALFLCLALGGILLWADRQCLDVAGLVAERGVPSAEATEWMAAGNYTVAALDALNADRKSVV